MKNNYIQLLHVKTSMEQAYESFFYRHGKEILVSLKEIYPQLYIIYDVNNFLRGYFNIYINGKYKLEILGKPKFGTLYSSYELFNRFHIHDHQDTTTLLHIIKFRIDTIYLKKDLDFEIVDIIIKD